jgi:hypothetical protein
MDIWNLGVNQHHPRWVQRQMLVTVAAIMMPVAMTEVERGCMTGDRGWLWSSRKRKRS